MNESPRMISAVFFGDSNSVFVTRTKDELSKRGFNISIIDTNQVTPQTPYFPALSRATRIIHKFISTRRKIHSIPQNTTAVIHYLSIDCFWLIPLLKKHFHRVVAIAYGSDVLRRKKSRDWLLELGLKNIDAVVATNTNVIDHLTHDFPFIKNIEHGIVRFGLPVFDAIDALIQTTREEAKRALDLDPTKYIVCLGYSASPGQRQNDMIKFFTQSSRNHKHIQFAVPVQYGPIDTANQIKNACKNANSSVGWNQFHAISEFYPPEKSALLRIATSVLINNSVSDSFSGTVQEVIYAGGLILAAAHLPYCNMPGHGTAIRSFRQLKHAESELEPESLQKWMHEADLTTESTRKKLHSISSWDCASKNWEHLISGRPT